MKNRNILISGASIAGPALAYWLRRYGFNPTVVERAPELRDGGYAVDFRGASMHAIERMGLLGEVRRAQTHMGEVLFVDQDNKPLASMPSEFMSGEVEILRGDLARILYEASRQDTEYLFGDSITSLTQGEEGVRVTFQHAPPRTFDLVVGADGLHSNVRALAFGDESRFVRDLGYYISIFTTPNLLELDYSGRYFSVPGKTVGVYSARRNTEAKVLCAFASPPLTYDRHDSAQQKRLLADRFAGEGWEIPRFLEAMWNAPDFYFDSISQVHMDSWSSGRTVLLGDAAYCASPLSGMGTGLAVVGAYVLAGELQAAGGDHRTAFARYQEQMRGYVQQSQKQGQDGGTWFVPSSRAMLWFRNQIYRGMSFAPWKKLISKMAMGAGNAITLKEYPV
ncbi:FAD-dependent monooxygenase [Vitiosangium sp. GDMCC 1.1324]|uniref:FAD-dependent monooxygenase n=1 Tax=Vitiosangium sp. (strain GDMCC 1.1324) TaxID=2138576 RepID=UPI000D3BAF4B|nr:FAD-dependent monooxygenase [Vitiosangium sp. GDMCC 1.1324]PTL76585.1 FAD-dependent oxidoreductase [Vitiosangium sp. GDMCC 1.1324]